MGQNKPLSVEQGNKLIALFMGATYKSWKDNKTNRYRFNEPIGETYAFLARELKYHTSYDWLMPVVEKISTIQFTDESWKGCEPYYNYAWPRTFGMRDTEGNYMVRFNASSLHTAPTLIEAAWLAVVDFIRLEKLQNSNNGK